MKSILLSDYTIEATHIFTPKYVDYISNLCDIRSKELKEKGENYTYERIHACFDNGRFAHGFYVVKCHDDIVLTFGVDEFEGWGVGTRYLRYNTHNRLFPLSGLMWTFLNNHLRDEVEGLCIAQNVNQRSLQLLPHRRFATGRSLPKTAEPNIFEAAIEVANNTKKLEYPVRYRGTVQEVYTYYTDKIPPFERA